MSVQAITLGISTLANPQKAHEMTSYFQAQPGGYAEGDQFLGVPVPELRKIAKHYWKTVPLEEIAKLLRSPIHEHRHTALFAMIHHFHAAITDDGQYQVVNTYLENLDGVNNWDLVDSSAHKILGPWCCKHQDSQTLFELAQSPDIWRQRVSIIATLYHVRHYQYDLSLRIADILLEHPHELVQKAVGWVIREVSQRDRMITEEFLRNQNRYLRMPRTTIRGATQKFPKSLQAAYRSGKLSDLQQTLG
jgi:3-methyladenine DNA glycosylase AlkD